MADEPLTHVIRPTLPWRNEATELTECGLRADSYQTLDRQEAAARVKKLGRQRSALLFCMTCLNTAERWPSWDEDPAGCLGREIERARWRRGEDDGRTFRDELTAITVLIDAHREEFDSVVAGLSEVTQITDRRRGRGQFRV